jgi:tetratricopeptide (TPR) repeat protein
VDLEPGGILAPFVEAGYFAEPARNTGMSMQLANAGAGLNFLFYPLDRIKVRVGAGAGLYAATYDLLQANNFYWKAGGEVGWRFSPGFTLAAGGQLVSYLYEEGSHWTGISLGITADLNLSLFSSRSSGIGAEGSQQDPVFPILRSSYEQSPVATATVTNTEQAEIRNVEVFFQVGGYTSAPRSCARVALIPRGKSVPVSLYASFSEQVLALSESTKVQGELIVSYTLLGARREARRPVTILFTHRNAARWKDERIVAAFVSPNDPAMLEHAKYVAGLVREGLRGGIDRGLQSAMGIFEGLRLSGISCTADPTTPYRELHAKPGEIDYLQYPYQTLAYRSGDCDDLAILYAAELESTVDVRTAFIPFADDLLVAVRLSMGAEEARGAFVDPSAVILHGGRAWVPVQVSRIREGFLAAWQAGARLCSEAAAAGSPARLITLEEAWKEYKPVGVPGVEPRVAKPSEAAVRQAFDNAVSRFVAREIAPQVQKHLARMPDGKGTSRQHNSLGMLYARYDMLKEARAQFERAAAEDSVPALCNLGNIDFLEGRYEEAVVRFERALALEPGVKAALLGLARSRYELDQFSESDALFSALRAADPALADRFAYLSSRIEGAASRASAAADRRDVIWSAGEE